MRQNLVPGLVIAAAVLLLAAAGVLGLYVMRDGEVQPPREEIAAPQPMKPKTRPFEAASTPAPVPQNPFRAPDGSETTLASKRGGPVLLNVWATWCAPCVAELPALARLQAKASALGLTVMVLNVDRGATPDVARDFLEKHEAGTLAAYTDPEMKLFRALRLSGLPVTLLIDADGNEIARRLGPAEWDTQAEIDGIAALLAAPR
jgi:thiol-disulfide isomerase/thioredoxin